MGATASRGAADAVRGLFEAGTAVGATDGELLERFAGRRDEGAFAALVERHGPMVLRACRSALGDEHAALDAFQATFLVLARKGGSLRSRDALGPWLHRVALRASGRERRALARRRAAERRAAEVAGRPAVVAAEPTPERDETAAVVHDEVDRLPGRYREAVVLCDLEGMTCEQAARRLGRPTGTVASRLARGRERLRERLRRRGLDPRAAVAAGPSAPLPNHLAESTASAALRFLAPATGPTWAAAALATGVLRAMTRTALCHAAAALLALGASTTGVVALAARGGTPAPAPAQEPAPPPPAEAKPAERPKAPDDAATAEARPAAIRRTIQVQGRLEPSGRVALRSPTAPAEIESMLAPGAKVARGDVVAVVRPANLRRRPEELKDQVQAAGREQRSSRLALEAAELALKEYEEATYPAEKAAANGAVKLAEAEFPAAQDRSDRLRRARERSARILQARGDAATVADLLADLDLEDRADAAAIAVDRARFALEQAQSRLNALETFARPRRLKQLSAELEKARADDAAKEQAFRRARDEEESLRRLIESCTIRAPIDGVVVDARPRGSSGIDAMGTMGPADRPVNQLIQAEAPFGYIQSPEGRLMARTAVPEVVAARLKEGQAVQVAVYVRERNLRRYQVIAGEIEKIGAADEPSDGDPAGRVPILIGLKEDLPPSRDIRIDEADVVLDVASVEGALGVPKTALVWYDGAYHVAVRGADGALSWREVVPGLADGETREVLSGVKPGEAVVAEPWPLLSEDQRRRISIAEPPEGSPWDLLERGRRGFQ